MNKGTVSSLALVFLMLLPVHETAAAGSILDMIVQKSAEQISAAESDETGKAATGKQVPKGVRVLRDISYGEDKRQRFDVYTPTGAKDAPVIFMVHGGAWRFGDKTSRTVLGSKVSGWVGRGFVFISANYRLLPSAGPLLQTEDVTRAIAAAQARAKSWGGDPSKFILMGHSAGAHLIALLAADSPRALRAGVTPWLGTILLDSAALHVENIMEREHHRLYDYVFGKEPSFWRSVSPFRALSRATLPILAVCSTRRGDSCPQARAFTAKASSLGTRTRVLEEDLSHREINELLGLPSAYTRAVEDFMGSLDTTVMRLLAVPAAGKP